jgi:hypothetical protein
MLRHSEQTNEIDAAIAAAQAEMGAAAKDSKNDYFGSSYADLASCWDAWRPAGPKNGLGLLQAPESRFEQLENPIQVTSDKGKVTTVHFVQYITTTTRLVHAKSGQWYESDLTILVKGDSPQQTVLGVTYGRRPAMCAMTGIAPQEDDDGNSGASHGADFGDRKPAAKTQPSPASLPDCPSCGKKGTTIIGKKEYGAGLVCFKNGGCKHSWETAEYPFEGEKAAKRKPPEKPHAGLGAVLQAMGCKTDEQKDAVIRHCTGGIALAEARVRDQSGQAEIYDIIERTCKDRMDDHKMTKAEALASVFSEALEAAAKEKANAK